MYTGYYLGYHRYQKNFKLSIFTYFTYLNSSIYLIVAFFSFPLPLCCFRNVSENVQPGQRKRWEGWRQPWGQRNQYVLFDVLLWTMLYYKRVFKYLWLSNYCDSVQIFECLTAPLCRTVCSLLSVSNTRFIAAVIERHTHTPERRRRYWGRSGTESDHGKTK